MTSREDLPKSIVVALIILAVFISVFGTWTVLNEINSGRAVVTQDNPVQGGKVSIGIIDPPSAYATAGGKVSLNIEEN
jgi:hypothetical protein